MQPAPKSQTHRVARWLIAGLLAAAAPSAGCGVDGALFDKITEDDFEIPPPVGTNRLEGQSTSQGSGAAVSFFTPAGAAIEGLSTTTGASGAFSAEPSASIALVNTVVAVTSGTTQYWGIIPEVPAKETVYDESVQVSMGQDAAIMADLGIDSTLATLMAMAGEHFGQPPTSLASLSPSAMVGLLNDTAARLADEEPNIMALRAMVERVYAPGAASAPPLRAFAPVGESFLDFDVLAEGLDLDGDEEPDLDTTSFDAALAEAVASSVVEVCYPDDQIRVVMMVDFNPGNQDLNCGEIDLFNWTVDDPGDSMYIVGSLHETTPSCESSVPPCLETSEFDDASLLLSNWEPNLVPMFDDGTNGDLVAGDNIWTRTFDMPYFEPTSDNGAWVRMHYKYTWGAEGSLWTGTEEWPGNSRLLELRDINGDRIVTRYDYYGDETSNKSASNLLAPGNGGCGVQFWENETPTKETCRKDTLENQIDTDGDCAVDSWPPASAAGPITIECP